MHLIKKCDWARGDSIEYDLRNPPCSVDVTEGNVESLPFAHGKFDYVY